MHMIYRWIAIEITKLFHVHRFSKLVTVFKKIHIYEHFFSRPYSILVAICKPLIGLTQMIRRWKAMKNPQLCYLRHFFEIPYDLGAVLNIHNNVVLEFSFSLDF